MCIKASNTEQKTVSIMYVNRELHGAKQSHTFLNSKSAVQWEAWREGPVQHILCSASSAPTAREDAKKTPHKFLHEELKVL